MREPVTRRAALAGLLVPLVGARHLQSQQRDSTAGAAGALGDPSLAGRPRAPTAQADNDARIQAIEKQLRCTCGCTLDIYTCRTTDFSCTYSPALHREVVALFEQGSSADAILDAFVAKYGEEALMAPEATGFNLAGYVVPGLAVLGVGATLVWALTRRRAAVALLDTPPSAPTPSTEELAELERAIADEDR